jgi:hypothetical protein
MDAVNPVVSSEAGAIPAATSRGEVSLPSKAWSYFKGALIVSAAIYLTITWALESVARFN